MQSDARPNLQPALNKAYLSKVRVTEFRCYQQAEIRPGPWPVVLTGPNGAGKTNILEAISMLNPGRGLRGARLADLARVSADADDLYGRGGGDWAVAATVQGSAGSADLGTGRSRAAGIVDFGGEAPASDQTTGDSSSLQSPVTRERRVVRIDGQQVGGPAALADWLPLLWLTPQMDRLFTETASSRRRFLDRLVLGVDSGHSRRVSGYEKAMRERARLLREQAAGRGQADPAWLSALEETMAGHGVAVAAARRETVDRLRHAQDQNRDQKRDQDQAGDWSVTAFPRGDMQASGLLEDWLETMAAVDVEERFAAALCEARAQDGASGFTSLGPHRSDLVVIHRENRLPAAQCSTGEQKALLTGIILVAARLRVMQGGDTPVLLLDEVAAHLDHDRRRALFDEICQLGCQAWITGTDRAMFDGLGGRAQFFRVEGAVITADGEIAGETGYNDDRKQT